MVSKPNTTSAHLSHSLVLKALFYLNTVFLSQKSTSAKSVFLGAKQSHTVTLPERQILLNTGQKTLWVCFLFFFFSSSKNYSNCLRKRHNMMFIPVYRCLTSAPSEGHVPTNSIVVIISIAAKNRCVNWWFLGGK